VREHITTEKEEKKRKTWISVYGKPLTLGIASIDFCDDVLVEGVAQWRWIFSGHGYDNTLSPCYAIHLFSPFFPRVKVSSNQYGLNLDHYIE
jgi:hypothetical protein